MVHSSTGTTLNGVAIIGMAGRFPGAASVDDLWRNLCEGVESITFFADSELEPSIDAALQHSQNYIKARGILEDVDKFDAAFFRMSPREAEITDPQHRIFLEVASQALENAGYNPDSYDGLIAVYGGTGINTYFTNHVSHHRNLIEAFGEHQASLANAPDSLATRVSYKLNLRGPSVSMYTGCSLSLVAVCHGCDSLMSYQCDMALAGGAFIECPQNSGYLYQEGEIYSSDGHCRPFDARAKGTVFSNGAGIVLLKRLEDALRDGDYIYAVIRGTAMNNDGSKKVSFTAPSVDGQAEVIAMAQANADVNPETISYIETHGTGTLMGDPVEIAALTQAFRARTTARNFCAVGSIKANIGHLDAAAGIAGLIKTTLMLKHRMMPPMLHFEKANPEIDFQNSPFYVNTRLAEWKSPYPRRAGVSSFGVGGTNAHVILEGAPDAEVSGKSRPRQLLLLSAKTSTALETATTNLADHLKHHPDLNPADVAYTLQVGRQAFNHRRMVVCRDGGDAVTALEALEPRRVLTSLQEPTNRDVVFIFSGQGAQYVNMGLELYQNEPVFREQINRCSEILQPYLNLDLRDIIYPGEQQSEDTAQTLQQTIFTQPALFTIEYALAKLWMAWGVHPAALVGHSIGEYVAACLAGVFSLEDALSLVATRGRLIQELPGGSMLAVFLSEKEIQPFLGGKLSLAVINGPSLCVVSGEKEAVEDLAEQLSNENLNCRHLHTSHAFHSKMIEPIINAFTEQVKQVSLNAPQIPFLSNVTGTWITSGEAMDPGYWARHLRQTVRFSDCLQELLKEPDRVLLEVGPGSTFSTLAGEHPGKTKEHIVLSSIRHPKEAKSDVAFILNTLGQLWLAGIQVDWSGFYADESRRRLPLPTYPFERQRHWSEAGERVQVAASASPDRPEEVGEVVPSALKEPEKKPAGDGNNNNIEQILANIWQESLGHRQVNYDDNFFDLGGTSLIAVRLFAKIEKILGRRLPLAALLNAPTIEQLASILRDDKKTMSSTSLVEIQSGGSKPPLFFVHAGGGNVLIYRDLVRHLGTEQPVYGLQSQGMDGERPFLTRIEDMAAHYIQEVQTVQPEGPYFLAGFCMGGTIALEMALQLQAQGQEVALLVFMETYNWGKMPVKSFLDNVHRYAQKIEFGWRRLLSGEKSFIRRRVELIKERIALLSEVIGSRLGRDFHRGSGQHASLYQLEMTNDRAADQYLPKAAFQGRIIHIVPTREYACNVRPELGWDETAAGGLDLYKLPACPRQMLVEPFVLPLAEILRDCIQKTLEQKPGMKM